MMTCSESSPDVDDRLTAAETLSQETKAKLEEAEADMEALKASDKGEPKIEYITDGYQRAAFEG